MQAHWVDQEEMKMESQELSITNRVSEDLARRELEAMERQTLVISISKSQSENTKDTQEIPSIKL